MLYNSFYDRPDTERGQRKGIVLLVVIAMLTLFATVGLAFVFYAEAEAVASGLTVQSQSKTVPDVDPELLLSYFLSQMVYDTTNSYSVMRGHSLARTMYGSNQALVVSTPTQFGQNYSAYSGVGRLHYPQPALGGDDYYFPNCQYYPIQYYPTDPVPFLRDPEFYGTRANASVSPTGNYRAGNAPYTYPDMNSMFLARVDADGSVIMPSFRRQWAENQVALNNANRRYALLFPDQLGYHDGTDGKGNAIAIGAFTVPDADLGGHVRNLDFSKGFKLPGGGYANNDSYFLDLGWPVMIAPNGKKYKALFAPLVLDLDNRINLWLAGNQRSTGSTGGTHVSNKGYGPSEINLSNIVTAAELNTLINVMRYKNVGPSYGTVPPQWPQRDGPISSRIDFDGFNGAVAPFSNGGLALPNPNNPNYAGAQYFIWPDYPNATYGKPPQWFSPAVAPSPIPTELLNHPLGYNIFKPGANNPLPSPSNMEAILRLMGTGAPAVTSDFFKSMPQTFGNPRNRGLLTSHSWNLDRITAAPYIPFSPSNPSSWTYSMGGGSYPTLNSSALPNPPAPLTSPSFAGFAPGTLNGPQAGSEFSATFNSTLINRLRINLNRLNSNQPSPFIPTITLFDYPPPDGSGYIDLLSNPANANQFPVAQNARQQLARDIYNVLVAVTGAQDFNGLPAVITSPQFQATRWLAQLAVNIVDYIDNDDIITPFIWYSYTDPATMVTTNDVVFGTEPPRLVINEAYAELDNNGADLGLNNVNDASQWNATTYNLNVWAELHNPFKSTPAEIYPFDAGVARPYVIPSNPKVGAYAAYELVLSQADHANLFAPGNNNGKSSAGAKLKTVRTWGLPGAGVSINPANGAFSDPTQTNNGFFVLGPATNFPASTPFLVNGMATGNTSATNPFPGKINQPSYQSPDMSYPIPLANAATATALNANGTTILLRRLACPYLPQNNTVGPNYNPYVTVDFVENVKTWDNRVATPTVVLANQPGPVTNYSATVRKEPYAASYMGTNRNQTNNSNVGNGLNTSAQYTNGTKANPGNAPADQPAGQALNTFFRHNSTTIAPPTSSSTFNTPFNWLVHLDRPIVNNLELLHVSAFAPHLLTQQFIVDSVDVKGNVTESGPFQHYAPWTDQRAMIFRVLELLGVPSYLNGTTMGGRVPGKININTMNEPEIWNALCDLQNVSSFNAAFVNATFTNLLLSRTPGGSPGQNDQPFKGFATGWVNGGDVQYPLGSGLQDTVLRSYPAGGAPLLKNTTLTHPYQQWELMQKIQNNVTNTSNVYAIWLTVGFFEVDDSFTPPKIGSEIGRDQGRQIRHRMFSIVDRSQLVLFSTQTNPNATGAITAGAGVGLTGAMPLSGNTANGGNWSLQAGMLLEFGWPGNMEVVVVRADAKGNPIADFTQNWAPNTPVTCRGNPGPWINPQIGYNPRNDSAVVPHYTIIQ